MSDSAKDDAKLEIMYFESVMKTFFTFQLKVSLMPFVKSSTAKIKRIANRSQNKTILDTVLTPAPCGSFVKI